MPLIVISGIPCSGKTTLAYKLKDYFENERKKPVEIVSEEDILLKLGYEKNSLYSDSQKEKRVRENIKSEVIRLVRKDNVVILDGSNYIKGFRYELYCATKSIPTTQCTVHPVFNVNFAMKNNEKRNNVDSHCVEDVCQAVYDSKPYTNEVFEALVQRYEDPRTGDRWDMPLFKLLAEDKIPFLEIWKALFENAPPPPNMSTQNQPLSSTNFLYRLDCVTQAISKRILDSKSMNPGADLVFQDYPGCSLEAEFMSNVESRSLLKLRRQFLIYAKTQFSIADDDKIGRYYLQYEDPRTGDRWDMPLFKLLAEDKIPFLEIWKALFENAPPPPNMSTQNQPLSSTNFLYRLDCVTQAISKRILDSKSMNPGADLVFQDYPGCSLEAEFMSNVESRSLLKLRRQFLIYAKTQFSIADDDKIGRYYLQYLNKSLQT